MSLVVDLLSTIDFGRQLCADFGLRPTTVLLRTKTYASGVTGQGLSTTVDVPLTSSGGGGPIVHDLGGGEFQIEQLTPPYPGGGRTTGQIVPNQPVGSETYIVLVGPDGFLRECKLYDVNIRDPWEYVLRVRDRT